MPDWAPVMQAALILGVVPWELAGFKYEPHEIPTCWITWALQYERVNIEARHQIRLEAEAQKRNELGRGT